MFRKKCSIAFTILSLHGIIKAIYTKTKEHAMRSARTAKHIIIGLLLLGILLVGRWYFLYPCSLSSRFPAERLRLSPQLPHSASAGGLHTGQQHHHIPAAKHGQPVSADRQGRLLCGAGFRRKISRLRNRVSGQRQGGTAYRGIAGTAEKLHAGGNA